MKRIIYTKNAPKPIGPYSQAVQINNILILSGQIPIDAVSNHIPKNISEQTYLVLANIKAILKASGFKVENIIKTTIFTTSLKEIDIINEAYTKFFIDNQSEFPARSCVEVQALPNQVQIEIETIAYRK